MKTIRLEWHDYKYYPYELRLADLEVRRLLGVKPIEIEGALQAQVSDRIDTSILDRFTYFRKITTPDGKVVIPLQARLEATATSHGDPSKLRKQGTRYSAHGIHEYRGKFNPQIVRSVVNLLGLEPGARILDPFCGSGTVLLEARHQGFDALGVDMNPLAVAISNAKIVAVRTPPPSLRKTTEFVIDRVTKKWETCYSYSDRIEWQEKHGNSDYLTRWFPLTVLLQLTIILESIGEIPSPALRSVYKVILSNIIRDVSWQDPNDLRIRRRKEQAQDYPAIELFVSAVQTCTETITAAKDHLQNNSSWQRAVQGDSSNVMALGGRPRKCLSDGIDCILSSPPYATALPYIDTQRLSLALLDIATPQEIRKLDNTLVGSREVSTRDRLELETRIDENRECLPDMVWRVCKELKAAYSPDIDGFRRQNTPAVVYRYFAGMAQVMSNAIEYIRSGGYLAFVVGPNRTTLGGDMFHIDTPEMLATIGEKVGLKLIDSLELETYSRYNMHSQNSIREERLLVMRRE